MKQIVLRDGRQLSYSDCGRPDGLPLLFHHGTPFTNYASPEGLIDETGFRLIRFSRPGYAHSSPKPGRRVFDVVDDVRQLLDHLEIGKFHVFGWSGGGPHALATAAGLPDRVQGCAILAGVAPFKAGDLDFLAGMGKENIDEFGAAIEGVEALECYLESQMPAMQKVTAEELTSALGDLLPDADRKELVPSVAEEMAASIREALEPGAAGWRDDDMAFTTSWGFELDSINVPVAVWWGSEDRMIPETHGKWLTDHLPGAAAHFLPGEGHISLVERHLPEFLRLLKKM